ncbi:hypothetical protein K9M42_01005 [Patescibacteria group bacterium]|nr:hypothetical protein [Patescibacteria group bacterium]
MKKILFKIREFFQAPDFPPKGEFPEEDRKKDFCVKAKNCPSYGTKNCPLFF